MVVQCGAGYVGHSTPILMTLYFFTEVDLTLAAQVQSMLENLLNRIVLVHAMKCSNKLSGRNPKKNTHEKITPVWPFLYSFLPWPRAPPPKQTDQRKRSKMEKNELPLLTYITYIGIYLYRREARKVAV